MNNGKRAGALALWWLWMPLVCGLLWLVDNGLFEGHKYSQKLDQFMLANVWSGGGWFWAWVVIGAFVSAFIVFFDFEGYGAQEMNPGTLSIAVVLVAIMASASLQLMTTNWDNDKDEARYYNQATTFVVPNSEKVPAAVRYLVADATESSRSGCDKVDVSDMNTCIAEGELPPEGWEPRIGSLEGAKFAIKRTSGDEQRVSLNEGMVTYLNEWNGQPARWSGVLDGKGREQSLGGVSEWDGSTETTDCKFEGKYDLDRAFGGERGNSLPNYLADRYPGLRYQDADVWGYCNGEEPIVVIPTTKQIRFKNRTVDTAGGLILVQGQDGKTKLTHVSGAKASDYPGPVYPMTLVERQRKASKWAAGRKNEDRRSFGFEPATSEAQAGNTSEFLLKNKKTGRLEWVTPLTLRKSSSELFVAYAITPADVVDEGELNGLSMYILGEDDPRRINIDNLEADALNFLVDNVGTFKSNGGKLVEFTPVDGDLWRAFGELNGRVVYRLDISSSRKITPKLTNLSPQDEKTAEKPDNSVCGQPTSELTQPQLVGCMQSMLDALEQRSTDGG